MQIKFATIKKNDKSLSLNMDSDKIDILDNAQKKSKCSSIIEEIFLRAISDDCWIAKICQLSLSKSATKIIMNAWKENINSREICLNLRSEYKSSYSTTLLHSIQTACNNVFGISITLNIEKSNNLLKTTPMELIYTVYTKRIFQLKQKFLIDPDFILIKSFFDTSFKEEDINIF